MNIKEVISNFTSGLSRKETNRLKYGAVGIVVLAGVLYWQLTELHALNQRLNQEIVAVPEPAAEDAQSGALITKAEGAKLEAKLKKYREIRKKIETFIPREGQLKPQIFTMNDIVTRIPAEVEVDRSERADDSAVSFSEQLGQYADPKNPKPTYKYQSQAFAFTLRATLGQLVDLLQELDRVGSYYYLRQLSMTQLQDVDYTKGVDPKMLVTIVIGSMYVHKNQAAK